MAVTHFQLNSNWNQRATNHPKWWHLNIVLLRMALVNLAPVQQCTSYYSRLFSLIPVNSLMFFKRVDGPRTWHAFQCKIDGLNSFPKHEYQRLNCVVLLRFICKPRGWLTFKLSGKCVDISTLTRPPLMRINSFQKIAVLTLISNKSWQGYNQFEFRKCCQLAHSSITRVRTSN